MLIFVSIIVTRFNSWHKDIEKTIVFIPPVRKSVYFLPESGPGCNNSVYGFSMVSAPVPGHYPNQERSGSLAFSDIQYSESLFFTLQTQIEAPGIRPVLNNEPISSEKA